MPHALLWLDVVAFAALFAAFFTGLKETLTPADRWSKYHSLFLLGLSVWILVATIDEFTERYVSRHLSAVESQIDACIALFAACAVLGSHYLFVNRLLFDRARRGSIAAAGAALAAYVVGSLAAVSFREATAEAMLCLATYLGVSALSGFALLRARLWVRDPAKRPHLTLHLLTVLFFPACLVEYLAFPGRSAVSAFSPAGLFVIPAYCLAVSAVAVVRSLGKAPPPARNEAVAEAFLEAFEITDREKDVILCLLRGYNSKRIADALGIARRTVDNHLNSVYRKCGVEGRLDLVRLTREFRR